MSVCRLTALSSGVNSQVHRPITTITAGTTTTVHSGHAAIAGVASSTQLQQWGVQLRASPRALRDNLTISRALLATPSASRAAASRVTAMTASAPTSPRKLRPTARPRAVYHVDLGSVRRGTWGWSPPNFREFHAHSVTGTGPPRTTADRTVQCVTHNRDSNLGCVNGYITAMIYGIFQGENCP